MSELPLVSVLTPCFNSGAYLEGCIQSVLAQDYPRVEHLIQDGASTDSTAEILARYADRVHVVSEPDAGQSDALNRALQRCRGDILVVLNADDELLPHACSWAVARLAEHPEAAAVYGDQFLVDPDGQILKEDTSQEPYHFVRMFCVEQIIPAQAAFLRRESLQTVGWHVDMTCKTCPDYELWVRLGSRFPLIHAPGLIARYRLHPESQGCQPRWIEAMVDAKRAIMLRTFAQPDAPSVLHRVGRRAEAGLLWWSADVYRTNGHIGLGARQALRALRVDPSPRQWPKIFGYFNHLPSSTRSPVWRTVAAASQALTFLPKWVRDQVRRPQTDHDAPPKEENSGLTLFAIPKPFTGHIGVIQRNAIAAWTRLEPRPQILLFGEEDGTAEAARDLGVGHIPKVACNEWGTPLLSDVLAQAEQQAESGRLCYVNADIILMEDFMRAVRRTASVLPRFLLAGRRCNLDVTEPLDFAPGWQEHLRRDAAARGELFLTGAIDYFCFPRGLFGEVPPFAIGRTVWDNWLLWRAQTRGAALVDATPSVLAVHQNHHYGHHAGGKTGVFHGAEAARNFALTGGEQHHYTLGMASLLVTERGVERRRPGRWMLEHAQTRWRGASRHTLRTLEGASGPDSYFGYPARALLRVIRLTKPVRGHLGRALTHWRDAR